MDAENYWTVDPMASVKLRLWHDGMAAEKPISVVEYFKKIAKDHKDHAALAFEESPNVWKTITYADYYSKVVHMAKVFIQLGLENRHSVGILCANCPQWFISAMGAIFAGGLEAGVYTTNSPDAICHILEKSRANVIVVEDEMQLEKVKKIKHKLPQLKAVILLKGSIDRELTKGDGYYEWSDLEEMDINDNVEEEYEMRLQKIAPNQTAALIFTSGTVGMPKGVMVSHDNFMWNCRQIELSYQSREKAKEVLVSYLPLSHVAGQCFEIFYGFYMAATVYFADKNALKGSLVNTLRIARPTRFMGVPRVFEKLQEGMIKQLANTSLPKRTIVNWAKQFALEHHMNRGSGQPTKKWQYLLVRNTILHKIKVALGFDRCVTHMCGAAPLAMDVKKFFMSLDMPLVEVYGMSECAGPMCLGDLDNYKLECVGKPMPGTIIKIANPDKDGIGEVLVKGRHVFMGYIGDVEKTREALDDDGFLHSGDLGYMDEQGYLSITGRIKELIITAGAENVPPAYVEELVKKELPCVSNAFLVGDRRKYLTMLITLKTEMDPCTGAPKDELLGETKTWLSGLGLGYSNLSDIIKAGPCPKVKAAIESGIVQANKHAISNAQKVQKFEILPNDFSFPTGELGPTLKLKRHVVLQMNEERINKMYEE